MKTISKILTDTSTSITNFKANPNIIVEESNGDAIAILKSNEPYFYVVPPALYEAMLEAMEDIALLHQANARMNDGKEPIKVNIDEI